MVVVEVELVVLNDICSVVAVVGGLVVVVGGLVVVGEGGTGSGPETKFQHCAPTAQ